MKLYIANLTRGPFRVFYRLDVIPPGQVTRNRVLPKHQDIPSGQQRRIGGDMVIGQIEDIIDQLNRFGMVGEVEIAQLNKRHGFVPLVFQLDKAVSPNAIRKVHDHNTALHTQIGADRRRRAALAANQVVDHALAELNQGVEELDVGFEQLEVSEADESPIDEGFRVVSSGPGQEPPPKAKGQRKPRGGSKLAKAA